MGQRTADPATDAWKAILGLVGWGGNSAPRFPMVALELDLSPKQLGVLWRLDPDGPGSPMRAIAESLYCDASYVTDLVGEWTGGAGADVAFEVSGAAAGVGTAVDVLGVRGRLCLVAIHPQPREVNLHRFFWRELTLVGARLYDRTDFEQAVRLVADGSVPADQLISKVVPLAEAASAFDALETGADVMKVLVQCA
jgi:D-arabinose 1-dehydrogenase-like Zn-dependent alcohol dehydrogenase